MGPHDADRATDAQTVSLFSSKLGTAEFLAYYLERFSVSAKKTKASVKETSRLLLSVVRNAAVQTSGDCLVRVPSRQELVAGQAPRPGFESEDISCLFCTQRLIVEAVGRDGDK